MRHLWQRAEHFADNLKIKNKFYLFYMMCVLLPLIVTDSYIVYIIGNSESRSAKHDMQNVANAVQNSFYNSVDYAASLGKNIYTSQYIENFLDKEYESNLDYVDAYQKLFMDTLLSDRFGMDHLVFTLYTDNPTVVDGGNVSGIKAARQSIWYEQLKASDSGKVLCILYDNSNSPAVAAKRRILFIQKLNFYQNSSNEKILAINMDYGTIVRNLSAMNYSATVYICQGDKIVLSNGAHSNQGQDFDLFTDKKKIGYVQDMELYGAKLTIYVLHPEAQLLGTVMNHFPGILFLILINIFLPLLLMRELNRSFIVRITNLSRTIENVEGEPLKEIKQTPGKDEISNLMCSYNKMVRRINALIEIVYKNRIHEQDILVAKQNAELLALHSQINPHFLFNALESIRMHSLLKQENETATMVEKLALMQRQYVDLRTDTVDISDEMDFVGAYLELQKYRFGDRLSYELQVDENCYKLRIPKLTIVTFVENACVHGIESKSAPGWIFVRISSDDDQLHLEVEDTGMGMPQVQMNELLADMQNASIEMIRSKSRIGVINACLRLKMISDNKVIFGTDGEEGVGMTFSICIPLQFVNGSNTKNISNPV